MNNNWYYWMLGGAMIGAIAIGMSINNMDNGKMKKIKKKAAMITRNLAYGAGDAISGLGDQLAAKMK